MNVWNFIAEKNKLNLTSLLLLVTESEGSSPGRQGFKMAISSDGDLTGTIGGGIMEHKWVELGRELLQRGDTQILIKKQYHDDSRSEDRSGMICSGMQWLVLVPITPERLEVISQYHESNRETFLEIHPKGLRVLPIAPSSPPFFFDYQDENQWIYRERKFRKPVVHIVGGGHVGLAVCRTMAMLDFHVINYDNRQDLITMERNPYAHEKIIVPYETIGQYLDSQPDDYLIIMTFGYRTDKIVLEQLLHRKFTYVGMMGSKAKTQRLFEAMTAEGVQATALEHIHAPIGLDIGSKTAEEISISIAAQIIGLKNGRT